MSLRCLFGGHVWRAGGHKSGAFTFTIYRCARCPKTYRRGFPPGGVR